MGDSFIFYKSWYNAIRDLPNDVRLEVYESAMRCAFGETVEGLKPLANVAFNFIKDDIQRQKQSYQSVVLKNKENGKKGGAPKGNQNAKKQRDEELEKQPKTTQNNPNNPNDNDNDNDNDFKSSIISNEITLPKSDSGSVDKERFVKFQKWINDNAPNVSKMKEPFTDKQFNAIIDDYEMQDITDLLLEMHNYKDLVKKNVSANLTFRKWMKIRNK
ncbi:MAG: DUF6291 domain-containing protein [Prevotellaceae bacterium]|jgi:hypothetical protein|nr:DUF6291 domain-containing protein [Prevotellaceae bacterium]